VAQGEAKIEGRMSPHLQFMAGPMLRYDVRINNFVYVHSIYIHLRFFWQTVENGVWHGFALIVTADAGSRYDPAPKLTYSYGSSVAPESLRSELEQNATADGQQPVDSANSKTVDAVGQMIYQYRFGDASNTFWRYAGQLGGRSLFDLVNNSDYAPRLCRFKLEVELQDADMPVTYALNVRYKCFL
jgi:hypothetical protein